MIIILHGLESKPNENKTKFFKTIDEDVFQPIINYKDVDSIEILKNDIKILIESKPENLLFIGTSMGGFLAEYFAHYFGGKMVIINPALFNKYTEFDKYKIKDRYIPGIVLLDLNDNVIDNIKTYRELKDTYEIIHFTGEGHRFSSFEKYRNYFEKMHKLVI